MMRCWLVVILLVLSAGPLCAQEFFLLGGTMLNSDNRRSDYSWQLEYREGLGEHLAYSISYLNEGHVPAHHRDGTAALLWSRASLLGGRLSLAAGAGPYYYYDTTNAHGTAASRNAHGWGTICSASATWQTHERWLFQLRSNWVETFNNIETFSALIGVGYQLEDASTAQPSAGSPPPLAEKADNEITLFAGATIVNSLDSAHSLATGLEYRRRILSNADWTVGWLYEGDNRLVRRNGLTTQLWAVKDFFDDRLSLGIGAGIYVVLNRYHHVLSNPDKGEALSGIVTLTGSYRLDPRWDVRASWNRIVTDYDRDTDVILGGIGYRF